MPYNIQQLAKHFAQTSFHIKTVQRFERGPGMSFNALSEPYPGFVFPLQGRAEFTFNGTSYLLKPGNVVHGGAQMQLDRRVIGKDNWSYLLVLYQVSDQEPSDFSLCNTHFELPTGATPQLAELLQKLWLTSQQQNGLAAFKVETLFRCLLDEIFHCSLVQSQNDSKNCFNHLKKYIDEHYAQPLTISLLAEVFQLNENRLFYLFHKYLGIGPWDYIITCRLNRAKDTLVNTDMPIHAIGDLVGYTDPYYFSRIFKKQFGLAPSKFREKFRNSPSFIHD